MNAAADSNLRQEAQGDSLSCGFDRGPPDCDDQEIQLLSDAEIYGVGGADMAGGCTVYELVSQQLDQAHQILWRQHERVLQLIKARPASEAEGNAMALAEENRVLREQLSICKQQTDLTKTWGLSPSVALPSPPSTRSDAPRPEGGAPEIEIYEDEIYEIGANFVNLSAEEEVPKESVAMVKPSALKRGTGINSQRQNEHAYSVLDLWFRGEDHQDHLDSWVPDTAQFAAGEETGEPDQHLKTYDDQNDEMQLSAPAQVSAGFCRYIVIHPNKSFRTFWDLGSMILVLHDMVMIPFGFFEPERTVGFLITEWITRVFWTMDMPMSFVSGYVSGDGTIEMRPTKITKKYLRSWFGLDCLVVGVDWMEVLASGIGEAFGMARMGKVFRIMRLLRLLRLAKVSEIVNLISEKLPSEKLAILVDILKLIVIMLGTGHLLACVWYAIGSSGPPGKNWLEEYGFAEEALDYRYVMSLRWALSQFAGGMDEVTPKSMSEHLYAAAVYLTAFWSGTVFLSILTSHMTQLYIMGNQQNQQLNIMRRYLSSNGISKGLALRVTRNAQHAMKMRQRSTPEAAVGLADLVSEPLRIELHFEMYFPLLGNHAFFEEYYKQAPHVVRKICHGAMSRDSNSMGDIIFHYGEHSETMMILKVGVMKYTWGGGNEKIIDVPGFWLSEAPLWTNWIHRGILYAVEDTISFNLDAPSFHKIVSDFKLSNFDPAHYAKEFVQTLNAQDAVTDLPFEDFNPFGNKKHMSSNMFASLKRSHTHSRISAISGKSGRHYETDEKPVSRTSGVSELSDAIQDSPDNHVEEADKVSSRASSKKRVQLGVIQPRTTWAENSEDDRATRPMTPEINKWRQQGVKKRSVTSRINIESMNQNRDVYTTSMQSSMTQPRAKSLSRQIPLSRSVKYDSTSRSMRNGSSMVSNRVQPPPLPNMIRTVSPESNRGRRMAPVDPGLHHWIQVGTEWSELDEEV